MRARDHERVPARGGGDVHERDRALVFVDDRRGQLAGDDLAEDAVRVGHRRSLEDRRPVGASALARVRERLLARGDLARRTAPRRAPRAARPRAGPGAMPSSRAELVAAQQRRAAGPRRASAARRRAVRRATRRWASIASCGAVAARGQPVGDRQQRDVDLDRRAGAQVAEHRRAATAAGARARGSRGAGGGAPAPRRARAAARSRAAARAPRAPARRRARRGR